MTRAVLVNSQTNIVVTVTDAACDANVTNYCYQDGVWLNLVLDPSATVGDTWNPATSTFTYTSVPQQVTAVQGRMALNAAGLRSAVENAVAAADQNTKDMWQFSPTLNRQDANLINLATSIGLSSAQIDQLFRSAATFSP